MASRSMDLNLNKQKFENNLLNLKIYIIIMIIKVI